MGLQRKVCLITNVEALQGAPDAAEFQAQGAILALHTRDAGAANAALVAHDVDLDGGPAGMPPSLIEADFGEPGVAAREIDSLVERTGRLDVLVNNNAPPHIRKPTHEIDDAEWLEMYHRIVHELFLTTRAAIPHMLAAGYGKILNIGAAGGLDPYRGHYTAYSSARAAVLNFTKGLGRELAPHNIQVNAIAQNYVENPSYFPPELTAKPSFQEWLKEQVPTGRLAKPWEQAKLAAFLVSEDADFLVGAVIPFSGGDTL